MKWCQPGSRRATRRLSFAAAAMLLLCFAVGSNSSPAAQHQHAHVHRHAGRHLQRRPLEEQAQLTADTPAAAPAGSGRLAIVYLAPKQHNSSSFRQGQDTLGNLKTSLMRLYQNAMGYQELDRVDVLLFHTGDFVQEDLAPLRAAALRGARNTKGPHKDKLIQQLEGDGGGPRLVELHRQHWRLPPFLHHSVDIEGWQHGAAESYNSGYFNMLRFFGILLFKLTEGMGYEWVMRLDDDSFIESPITYDLVGFMQENNYDYGYRITQTEGASFTRGFPEALHLYITMFDVKPTFLYEHCKPESVAGLVGGGWDAYAYYDNWFIARNTLFTNRKAQHFLAFMDRIGGIYTQRWGDALIHAAVVQMFTDKARVREFTDFRYKHNWMTAAANSHCHWGADGVKVTPA